MTETTNHVQTDDEKVAHGFRAVLHKLVDAARFHSEADTLEAKAAIDAALGIDPEIAGTPDAPGAVAAAEAPTADIGAGGQTGNVTGEPAPGLDRPGAGASPEPAPGTETTDA